MASAYFMGIDTGTFASKGVLIDADASVVAQSAVGHGMENPRPNFYEHDAESVWWHDFCQISNELISKSGIDPKEIGGVAASALGADCLPVDEECNPFARRSSTVSTHAPSTNAVSLRKCMAKRRSGPGSAVRSGPLT